MTSTTASTAVRNSLITEVLSDGSRHSDFSQNLLIQNEYTVGFSEIL